MTENLKSDVKAKEAFRIQLLARGFETAVITGTPADITATQAGQTHYFEIKFTRQVEKYFGAATLTEWDAALQFEERFTFVIALERDGSWVFHEYSPAEFMQMSYVPPFKIFFNVGVNADKTVRSREGSGSVGLTRRRLELMSELFNKFREGSG
jgi:hypothetical protein